MTPGRTRWTLTREAFDYLLLSLGPDRESAGEGYERLRRRVLKFFMWERCPDPESCADETLNRIAHNLERGEKIQKLDRYALAVARLVLLEARAQARKTTSFSIEPVFAPAAPAETERWLACLDQCMAMLPVEQRALLLDYYRDGGRLRTQNRQRMAAELHIDVNALRNRAMRLRERLETCVRTCVERNPAR